jgi:NAD(P)-dependent dehydrogenase (short-subunit alcohol dehydrogenase family)
VNYVHDKASAENVLKRIKSKSIAVQADVSIEADVVRLFETVDTELGRVTALVNNAGIVVRQARLEDMSAERIQRMLAVNVLGVLLCAREAVKRMSTRHGGAGGAIVNVSSAAARLGSPGEYVDYAASKGAVDTLTLGLAKELAPEGIRVTAVRPGFVNTDIHAAGGEPNRIERLRDTIPMKRGGEPEEIARAILWLLSEEASFSTGAILDAAGGR